MEYRHDCVAELSICRVSTGSWFWCKLAESLPIVIMCFDVIFVCMLGHLPMSKEMGHPLWLLVLTDVGSVKFLTSKYGVFS